jgi:hypothetical protein
MSATRNRLIDRYLEELRAALRDLPRRQRDELVGEIEAHITETVPPEATDAEVLTALDRIGEPEQIAAAERERLGMVQPAPGWLEWLAIALLLVGGLVLPVIGWIVGVVFLWLSRCWTLREKLLGTLVIPGGLMVPLLLPFWGASVESCSTGSGVNPAGSHFTQQQCTGGQSALATAGWIAVEVLLILAPIGTAILLARRARGVRPRRAGWPVPSRTTLAALALGLGLGAGSVWLFLNSRAPGATARAEVMVATWSPRATTRPCSCSTVWAAPTSSTSFTATAPRSAPPVPPSRTAAGGHAPTSTARRASCPAATGNPSRSASSRHGTRAVRRSR